MSERRVPICPWPIPPATWREICQVVEDPIGFLQEECPELLGEFRDRQAPTEETRRLGWSVR